MTEKKWALISVFDKTGIVDFARQLLGFGYQLLASGGTAKKLRDGGLPVTDVAELTGLGAILNHRVVTLQWQVYAGLLATDSESDVAELAHLGLSRIDLVCVDMYPLLDAIAQHGGKDPAKVLEATDIGGPTMLRAGAKGRRIVVCDPLDRASVLLWMQGGCPDEVNYRKHLAAKAEGVVADYCLTNARYLSDGSFDGFVLQEVPHKVAYAENRWRGPVRFFEQLRYPEDPLAYGRFLQTAGDPVGYIGVTDWDRSLNTLTHIAAGMAVNFGEVPLLAVAVKHGNVCGAAYGSVPQIVLTSLVQGDSDAIFGGVVMTNFPISAEGAHILRHEKWPDESGKKGRPLDGIICPDISSEALPLFERKDNRCRVFLNEALGHIGAGSLNQSPTWRQVRGGFLQQGPDNFVLDLSADYVKKSAPLSGVFPSAEWEMVLGWAVGSTSNSNTIVLTRNGMVIANAVGQQSRVAAAELAVAKARKAGHDITGAVAYSDSFFPATDAVKVLTDAGVQAIFASEAGLRFAQVEEFCRKRNIVLYTGPDAKVRGFFGH